MSIAPHKTERLHSLDSLRAIMMMLGVVLHGSISYIGGDPSGGWPLRDPSTESYFLEWMLSVIHNFRMPIFMVVAGFFAALLFYDRSPKKMMLNRANRILFPFLVFVVLLWPLVTLAFSYSNEIFSYDTIFDTVIGHMYINTTLTTFSNFSNWIPETTMHLWFIYYLIFFSIASYALGLLLKNFPKVTKSISLVFDKIIVHPILKILVFAILTFLILKIYDSSWVATSTSFVPELFTFVFYFLFYCVGWILFKSKHLLTSFMKYDWLITISALIIYTIYFFMANEEIPTEVRAFIKSCTVWMFFFGFTGLFLRYFSEHSSTMRYVSDSSYWVYLLHLPLTALIPGLIGDWNLPSFIKFSIVVSATLFICLLSYHYLVRTTFIGQFLNGRKYSRKLSDINKAQENSELKPVLDS